jgi:hypothetical protein
VPQSLNCTPVLAVARTAVLAPALLAPVVAVARAAVLALALLAPVLAVARTAVLIGMSRYSTAPLIGMSRYSTRWDLEGAAWTERRAAEAVKGGGAAAHANPDPAHGRHELRGDWRVLRAQPHPSSTS